MNSESIIDSVNDLNKGDEKQKVENTEDSGLAKEQKEKSLEELLSFGRRAIKVNDIENATEILSQATELSIEIYGENHENTFDAHYFYGMAALESAKIESQLLANPNSRGTEQNEENDEAEVGGAEEKPADDAENGDESEKEEGEESGEEDDDAMRLAWEILEIARCIAVAKIEKLEAERSGVSLIEEWNLKLADVLVLLGEHGISDGKYEQAREDLDNALEIQKNFLPVGSRKTAQTYILMANALSTALNFKESISYYEKTKECLLARQTEMKIQAEEPNDEKKAEAVDELKELDQMIISVDKMIEDAILSAEQVEETTKAVKEQFAGFTSVLSQLPQDSNSTEKEANDITNLVRRPAKRPTTTADDKTDEAKKTKDEGPS